MGEELVEKKIKLKKERKELSVPEIINVLLYSVVVFMPFIFSKGFTPMYTVGKMYYLYAVGSALIILMIKDNFGKFKTFKCRIEIKIAIVFLIFILVSSVFSMEKRIGFFGSYYRREGFFMYCVYITVFIASIKYFTINKVMLKLILFVADFMAIYGISQFFGWDPFLKLIGISLNTTSAIGFIGNRNFLSTYLLIFLFISVGMYIFYKEKIYLFISIPLFTCILCTLTRGGWIGFIVYSLIGLFFILKRKQCLKRAFIVLSIFLVILVVLDGISGKTITGRANKSNIVNASGELVGSAGGRMDILRMSFNAFKNKPLFGSGPDNLIVTFSLDFKDDMENHKNIYNEIPDKAHNEYLEYAASCGIFALIAYLSLIACIIKGLINNINDDRSKIMILVLVGYLVQAFFNISVVMVAPIYWIMIGVFIKFINEDFKEIKINKEIIR